MIMPTRFKNDTLDNQICKGYKPKTVHSVRERTDRGPSGREQFFLSQNVQFEAFILLKTLFSLC